MGNARVSTCTNMTVHYCFVVHKLVAGDHVFHAVVLPSDFTSRND